MKKLFIICMTALLAGCNTNVDLEKQVDELYAKMSQEERIAQLRSMYMDELLDDQGKVDTAKCRQLIPNGIGHFSQFAMQKPTDPNVLRDRVAAVQDWLIHHTPSGIPALFHEEVLSGVNTRGATIYPQQIGQACSFNAELAELLGVTPQAVSKWENAVAMPDISLLPLLAETFGVTIDELFEMAEKALEEALKDDEKTYALYRKEKGQHK